MQTENKYLIPVAIVIAGVFIAGAVMFKGKTQNPPLAGDPNAVTEQQPADIDVTPASADDHILGNPNAPITIIDFSDIDCPFCAGFHITMKKIIDEYGKDGQVAWVYRHFPIDQLHPDARLKAESTECVAELGGNEAFWAYLDLLFARQETGSQLAPLAAEVGVDTAAFESCVTAKKHASKVQEQLDAAFKAGGRGTPYSIILTKDGDTFPINGAQPYEVIKQVIDTILKGE